MTCDDCIHYNVCYDRFEHMINYDSEAETKCKDFIDKSKFIELPCKIGQTFHTFYSYVERQVSSIEYDKDNIYINDYDGEVYTLEEIIFN